MAVGIGFNRTGDEDRRCVDRGDQVPAGGKVACNPALAATDLKRGPARRWRDPVEEGIPIRPVAVEVGRARPCEPLLRSIVPALAQLACNCAASATVLSHWVTRIRGGLRVGPSGDLHPRTRPLEGSPYSSPVTLSACLMASMRKLSTSVRLSPGASFMMTWDALRSKVPLRTAVENDPPP